MQPRQGSEGSSVGLPHRGQAAPATGMILDQHPPQRPRSSPGKGRPQCGQRPGSSASMAAANTPPRYTADILPEAMLPQSDGYTAPMKIIQHEIELPTEGHGHIIDLTGEVTAWLGSIGATRGQVTVFVPGSTAAVTTIEFEPGALRDLNEALERLAPSDGSYHHDLRWGTATASPTSVRRCSDRL